MGGELKIPTSRASELATDLYVGAIAGITGAVIIALSCGLYYAHAYLQLNPAECCLYSAFMTVLLSKPLLITGAAGGAGVGAAVYLTSKWLRRRAATR